MMEKRRRRKKMKMKKMGMRVMMKESRLRHRYQMLIAFDIHTRHDDL
jgi:hypothetical protein